LLAIALSGKAAQTKDASQIRTLQAMSEGFENLIQELAKPIEQLPLLRAGRC
jgi:hypothetical protein